MPEVEGPEKLFSDLPQKRFSRPREYGTSQYGFSHYGEEDIVFAPEGREPIILSGIYRRGKVKNGYKVYREPFYITRDPKTPAQQANRQKFANAMQAWKNLTSEQKNAYNERAEKLRIEGVNLFIREYMLSHQKVEHV